MSCGDRLVLSLLFRMRCLSMEAGCFDWKCSNFLMVHSVLLCLVRLLLLGNDCTIWVLPILGLVHFVEAGEHRSIDQWLAWVLIHHDRVIAAVVMRLVIHLILVQAVQMWLVIFWLKELAIVKSALVYNVLCFTRCINLWMINQSIILC